MNNLQKSLITEVAFNLNVIYPTTQDRNEKLSNKPVGESEYEGIKLLPYAIYSTKKLLLLISSNGFITFIKNHPKKVKVLNLGAGEGRSLFALQKSVNMIKKTEVIGTGYEIQKCLTETVPNSAKSQVDIIHGDFLDILENICDYQVVFSFLPFVGEMEIIFEIMKRMMTVAKPNTLFVLEGFPLSGSVVNYFSNHVFEGKFCPIELDGTTNAFIKIKLND